MRRFLAPFWLLPALLFFLAAPAFADELPQFVIVDDTLTRHDHQTGEALWKIEHTSAWQTKKQETIAHPLYGPVEFGGEWYYAIGTWLLRLDADSGVIEERISFPAPIEEIEVVDDALAVTVRYDGEYHDEGSTNFTYRPGGDGPRELWTLWGWLLPWKDASYLADSIGHVEAEYEDADHRDAIERLKRRRTQEPANPFYDFFAGWEYERLGESDEATLHYDRAVDVEGAHWSSDFQLAMLLDRVGRYDLADVAFDRAMTKLDDENPALRQSSSLVLYSILLGVWQREAVEAAVEAEDFEAIDRMHSRAIRFMPYLEFSPLAWDALADWYAEHDRTELAAKWRSNAERARQSPWQENTRSGRQMSLAFTLLIAFLIGGWLTALVVGLRTSPSRWQRGLPIPRRLDIAALVLALALPWPCVWAMDVTTGQVMQLANAPLETIDQSWGYPVAHDWLEGLTDSPERTTLLEYSEKVRSAQERGEPAPPPLDDGLQTLVDAIEADAVDRATGSAFHSGNSYLKRHGFPPVVLWIGPWLLLVLFTMPTGAILRRCFPRLSRVGRWLVPGGATAAGPLTPLIAGLTIGSLLALLFNLDNILLEIAAPNVGRYFGLQGLPGDIRPRSESHAWAWIALGGALVAHALTTWLEARRGESVEDPTISLAGRVVTVGLLLAFGFHLMSASSLLVGTVAAISSPSEPHRAVWQAGDETYRDVKCQRSSMGIDDGWAYRYAGRHYSLCEVDGGETYAGVGAFDPEQLEGDLSWPIPSDFVGTYFRGLLFGPEGRFGAVISTRPPDDRPRESPAFVGLGDPNGWVIEPYPVWSEGVKLTLLGMQWEDDSLRVALAKPTSNVDGNSTTIRLLVLTPDDDVRVRELPLADVCESHEKCTVEVAFRSNGDWSFVRQVRLPPESDERVSTRVEVEIVDERGQLQHTLGEFEDIWSTRTNLRHLGLTEKPPWVFKYELTASALEEVPNGGMGGDLTCAGSLLVDDTGAVSSDTKRDCMDYGPVKEANWLSVGDGTVLVSKCPDASALEQGDLCVGTDSPDRAEPVAQARKEFAPRDIEARPRSGGGYVLFSPSGRYIEVDADMNRVNPRSSFVRFGRELERGLLPKIWIVLALAGTLLALALCVVALRGILRREDVGLVDAVLLVVVLAMIPLTLTASGHFMVAMDRQFDDHVLASLTD